MDKSQVTQAPAVDYRDVNGRLVRQKVPFVQFYEANKGLIYKVARKVFTRTQAMGASVEMQDIEQEATIVMMRAYERFDPELGFTFSTYFMKAAYYELNSFLASYEKDLKILGVFSIQRAEEDSDSKGGSYLEGIDGGHPSPEQLLECKQTMASLKKDLSPLAAVMLEIMIDPPEQFSHEWEVARQLGTMNRQRQEMTLGFIGEFVQKLTGATGLEIRNATVEIGRLGRSLNV